MKRSAKWLRAAVTVLVVVAVAAGAYYARRLLSGRGSADATTSQLLTVSRGNVVASISPTGQVEAVRSIKLSFDVTRIPLVELNAVAGQTVTEGDILARLDTESLQLAVEQAEASVSSAFEALQDAQAPYDALDELKAALAVTQAETALLEAQEALTAVQVPDLDATEAAVSRCERALASAQLNLQITQRSSTVGKAVRDLEYTVAWYERSVRNLKAQVAAGAAEQSALDEASETLSDALTDLTVARRTATTTLSDAQERVTDAEDALALAKEELAELQAGPDALDLAQAQHRLVQAEYGLAVAQESAAEITAGPSDKDVRLAQARYDAALATLAEVQATLDAATMTAPFDGTVVSVGADVGDLVSSNNTIITLADLSALRVVASIDETEIIGVQVGMPATITFDSLSGQRFTGAVEEIPLEGTVSSSVVTYAVPISLQAGDMSTLLPGMTANISMEIGHSENALLLPILAVQDSDDGSVVTLADGSMARVELGLDDGQYVEVVRGLMEGDQVLVTYRETTTSQGGYGQGGGSMLGVGRIMGR